jgi:hypothetical protein
MIGFGNRTKIAVMLCAMLLSIFLAWNFFSSARNEAAAAMEGLDDSIELVEKLKLAQNKPRMASLEVEPPDRIASRVTIAAEIASIPSAAIQSIDPQSPVRLGQSAYEVRSIAIVLQNVTLLQTAQFAQSLQDMESGMVVSDLQLNRSLNVGEDNVEYWNTRMTLTQMIFSPISGG